MLDLEMQLATLAPIMAPVVAGAFGTLTLTALAQRFHPTRWGRSGRSRASGSAVQGGGQDASAAAAPCPAEQPTPRGDDPIAAFRHDHLMHRPRVAPIKAAHMLIEFMQEHEATGYFTPKEIDAWWKWMVKEHKLDDLHPSVVRGELAAIPNTWVGLRRLNAPEFRAVKARTGKDRSILYRIPASRVAAGAGSGEQRSARAEPGARSGKCPANPKKRVLTGPDSWSADAIGVQEPVRRAA